VLSPADRRLFLEAIRPPPGYALDRAVGTTYSLDLLALLTTPLAFTIFDWEGGDDTEPDALVLLEALRRTAGRVTVFCQAGQISVPRQHRLLFAYIEDAVVEVAPPKRTYVFHPKVWALRFAGPGGDIAYRLLVMTRNLTFDISWDTLLVLDGALGKRKNAIAANHPLGDFFAALPGLAVRRISKKVSSDVDRISRELRRVSWTLPEGFQSYAFHPLGLSKRSADPFHGRRDRMLIVSPFLSPKALNRLRGTQGGDLLVSRPESVELLRSSVVERFSKVYQLSMFADAEELGVGDDANPAGDAETEWNPVARGLHAKLYVADAGWKAHLWTGSANATDAAFGGNVEFLVQFTGSKAFCGIHAILNPEPKPGTASFLQLLEEMPPSDGSGGTEDDDSERALRKARLTLATTKLRAEAERAEEEDRFRLKLVAPRNLGLPDGLKVRCWPVSLKESLSAPFGIDTTPAADFGVVSMEALTSFYGFELTLESGSKPRVARFVLNLPLKGGPTDRPQRILTTLLKDEDQVLRFLLLLLALQGGDDLDWMTGSGALLSGWIDGTVNADRPVLESLLRALDRDPRRIDEVHRFLHDLEAGQGDPSALPEGFNQIWKPIWEEHRRRRKAAKR
jgi:hypothetical protein